MMGAVLGVRVEECCGQGGWRGICTIIKAAHSFLTQNGYYGYRNINYAAVSHFYEQEINDSI